MPYELPDPNKPAEQYKDPNQVGYFESALAGIGSGLINIPKGIVSLGAELYDLVGDTNTAKEVEHWFDSINPFDETAEAQTIGRITKAIAQVAPVGVGGAVLGARAGALAKTALEARKTGKYLSLTQMGAKIAGPTSGAIVGGGLGESLVTDKEIGTFADMLRGTSLEPFAITMMDIEDKEGREEAYRRLLNRVKFGTEGALFNLALTGAGKGINALRKPSEEGLEEYSQNSVKRFLEKYGTLGSVGSGTRETFQAEKATATNIRAAEYEAYNVTQQLQKSIKESFPTIKNEFLSKSLTSKENEEAFFNEIKDVLTSKDSKLLDLSNVKNRLNDKIVEGPNGIKKIISTDENLITKDDYIGALERSPKFKKLAEYVEKTGGDRQAFEDAIISMRSSVDTLSLDALQKGLPKKDFDTVFNNLGSYLTTEYEQFKKLNPLKKYEPTAKQIEKAENILTQNKLLKQFGEGYTPAKEELDFIKKESSEQVQKFLKRQAADEADIVNKQLGKESQIGKEISKIKVDPSILISKVLEPWQQELFGVIKDPTYTFLATIGKQSHLNETIKFMDKITNYGTKAEMVPVTKIVKGKVVKMVEQVEGKNVPINQFIDKETKLPISKEEFFKKNFIFSEDELKALGKEFDINNPLKFKKVEPIKGFENLTGLEGKYMKAPIHDAVFDVTNDWLSRSSVGTLYKYAILAPKAVSQVAKTILSPITHVRNFITAGAFAAANGAVFPSFGDIKMLAPKLLGGEGLVGTAYGLTGKRLLGTMTEADKDLYRRLLKVDVVGTQIEARQANELMSDVINASDNKVMDKLLNVNKKVKAVYGKAQDAYVAEDDFWKVISWNLERNRYEKILEMAPEAGGLGINKFNYLEKYNENSKIGEFLRDKRLNPDLVNESYQSFLDEFAGNLVRNQVPNYDYISKAAKTLRMSPFGNFIAFPLEMIRTGNNIFQQSIKEITSDIPAIKALGLRRLMSFGMTVGGIPIAVAEAGKALNNVTDGEIAALRRFVPEWSKNSTLVPTGRDEKGYIKYIDFSYANPYDTLIRPLNAILANIAQGNDTKESLTKALGKGLIEGTTELLAPFTSESIFTEALVDSTLRRGIGREGKRVWNEEDDPFVKILKGLTHVSKSFEPGSLSQLKRLNNAVKGQSDEYGKSFELQDELPGLFGFRSIQSDPENGLKYKITRFGSNLDKDRNLFSSPLLKGGRVDPNDIVSNYQYSEARRFQTMKEMYEDIDAARRLGVSNAVIEKKLKERKGMDKDVITHVMSGKYLPDEPNKFFITKMQEINNDLNRKEGESLPNPYLLASPAIRAIQNKNRRLNLKTDQIEMPFAPMKTGVFEPQNILPATTPNTGTPVINNQTSALSNQQVNPATGLTQIQTALLSPEEQLIEQRRQQRQIVG